MNVKRAVTTLLTLAIAVIIALTVSVNIEAAGPQSTGTFNVWVAPDGSDARDTTSKERPVETLNRAQQILEQEDHAGPAVVRVEGGTYDEWGTVWTYQSEYGTSIKAYGGTPIFSGGGTKNEYGLTIEPEPGEPNDMNLSVAGLKWVNATNGIRLNETHHVRLKQLAFERIGSEHSGNGNGYAALSLVQSHGTLVAEPRFEDIENTEPRASYIHAVYMSDETQGTRIVDGWFSNVSGDPVRVRNGSNSNSVEGGSFGKTGRYAIFSAWFDPDTGESPSTGNSLVDATTGSNYEGSYALPLTACFAGTNDPVEPCGIDQRGNH